MTKSKNDNPAVGLILALVAFAIAYKTMGGNDDSTPDTRPLPIDWSMLDDHGRIILCAAVESLATQIADDANFRRPRINSEQDAIEIVRRTMSRRLGSSSQAFDKQYPGTAATIERKIGKLDNWPAGRRQLVQRLNQIATELRP